MKWISLAIVALLSTIANAGEWDMTPPDVSWSMTPSEPEGAVSFDMTPALVVKPATLTRVVPAVQAPGYPVRGGHWTVDGYSNPGRDYLIAHLLNGQHAGKFDAKWLASLSHQELLSLHDDDHENRYRGQVVRAARTQRAYRTVPAVQYARWQACPNGRCPR